MYCRLSYRCLSVKDYCSRCTCKMECANRSGNSNSWYHYNFYCPTVSLTGPATAEAVPNYTLCVYHVSLCQS